MFVGQLEGELYKPGDSQSTPIYMTTRHKLAGPTGCLRYNGSFTAAIGEATGTDRWNVVVAYTVPSGKVAYGLSMETAGNLAGVGHRSALKRRLILGTHNGNTNVFTQGSTVSAGRPALTNLYCVSGSGGVNPAGTATTAVTITYTNQDRTTGRTATGTFPDHSFSGERIKMTLRGDDTGVMAVTAMSVSPTSVSTITVGGDDIILFTTNTTVNHSYQTVLWNPECYGIAAGEDMTLEFTAGVATAHPRYAYVKYKVVDA